MQVGDIVTLKGDQLKRLYRVVATGSPRTMYAGGVHLSALLPNGKFSELLHTQREAETEVVAERADLHNLSEEQQKALTEYQRAVSRANEAEREAERQLYNMRSLGLP
jgi:hypothetical protein